VATYKALVNHLFYVLMVGKDASVTNLSPGSGEIVIQDRLIKWVKVYLPLCCFYAVGYALDRISVQNIFDF